MQIFSSDILFFPLAVSFRYPLPFPNCPQMKVMDIPLDFAKVLILSMFTMTFSFILCKRQKINKYE